jgi:hypothetical protein
MLEDREATDLLGLLHPRKGRPFFLQAGSQENLLVDLTDFGGPLEGIEEG